MSSYKTDRSQIVLNYPRILFFLYILSAAKQLSVVEGTSGIDTNETLPKVSLSVSQTKNGTNFKISDAKRLLKIPSVNNETFSESTSVSGDSAWMDADQPNLLYLSHDSLILDANFTNGSAIFGRERIKRNNISTAIADKSLEILTTTTTTLSESMSRRGREFATIPCDTRTHVGCKVDRFERCGDRGRCQCLRGYMFSPQTGFCVAVQFFWAQLYLWRNFSLVQPWSEISNQYKLLKQQLRDKLLLVFRSQKIPGLMDIQVFQISWQLKTVEVKFQIFFDKRLAPRNKEIEQLYKDGLKSPKIVHKSTNGLYVFVDSRFAIRRNATQSSQITEYNPCADSTSNYCGPNAKCKHTMKSFTCACRPGYEDTSPDISRAPGEVCSVWCGCQNNGTCQRSNGEITCRCMSWYLGEKCEINGKNLVIILCSTLGGLLLLTILICLLCIFFCRRKARKSNSTRHLSASDSTLVKLPRLWNDAVPTPMYDAPAVSDRRRWSYVSDPIRYPEDLIQEDLFSTGTLPLPRTYDPNRRHLMAYQNPSYQSSTLPLRPPYHQDKWRSGYQPSLSIPF